MATLIIVLKLWLIFNELVVIFLMEWSEYREKYLPDRCDKTVP
jgi:hypothetical protein